MTIRSSILARLMIVSLAVLGCSIFTTAFIITRSTTDQLEGEISESVADQDSVYDQLLAFAETHPNWNDAQQLVESFGTRDRRITLTTLTGVPVADSAAPADRSPIAAGSTAKRIDALPVVMQQSAQATQTVVAGASSGVLTGAVQGQILDGVANCLSADNLFMLRSYSSDGVDAWIALQPSTPEAVRAVANCQATTARTILEPLVAPAALLYFTDTSVAPTSKGWLERAGGTRIMLALLAVLLVTVVITLAVGRRVLRPIRSMTRATQRIAGGDRLARVRITGNDELARLGSAFNTMADSIETSERQRQQLVSDVAHELRNPLANVRGYLEGVQDNLVRADGAWVESLLEETMLLQRLIDDLQDLALADAGRLRIHAEWTDAATLAAHVVAAHRHQAETASVTVSLQAPATAPLVADPVRIRQVIGNLVSNALHYTPPNGAVTVAVRLDPRSSAIVIEVADTGIGIEPEHLSHLFDRFYRADSSRSRETGGSGLGLAIVRHLVEAHGGVVEVASTVGRGSTFTIRLPIEPAHRSSEAAPVLVR